MSGWRAVLLVAAVATLAAGCGKQQGITGPEQAPEGTPLDLGAGARAMGGDLAEYGGAGTVSAGSCQAFGSSYVEDMPQAGYVNRFRVVFTSSSNASCLGVSGRTARTVRVASTTAGVMEVEVVGQFAIVVRPGDPALQNALAASPGQETRAQFVTITTLHGGRDVEVFIDEPAG